MRLNYKKLFIQLIILVPIILAVYIVNTIIKRADYVAIAGFAQGTSYHITYESKNDNDFHTMIDSILHNIDMSLSIYQPNSIISKMNRNEPGVKADKAFTDVFNKSMEVNKETDGAFDITVGPIVNALGFGSTDTLIVDSSMIDSLLQYVGMNKVRQQEDLLVKDDSHILLDANAIAQGYSVDEVARFLEKKKVRNYLVEIGGEVRARGKNPANQDWNIGIDKPIEGNNQPGANLQVIIKLRNSSLATSGNYRKFYEKNGIKYVHTVNPKTGYPAISKLLSATVVAKDCITADAYATALMVFGLEKSIEFLNKHTFLDAYLIYADNDGQFEVYVTPQLKESIAK
jgi:FAD:protein FMN transferase